MNRRAFALAAWMAMLAVLMAVLAPALSHAFGADPAARFLPGDICRAGSVAAAGEALAGGAPAPPSHEEKRQHCPYCHHGNGVLLLPPAPHPLALAVADAPPTAPFPDAPKPRFAWTAAHARGPPWS
ncbi:DUF2946 domain-containing protein [Massilia rubra]|nr:DUF2946 domain-containing protein [Massilia rubra]